MWLTAIFSFAQFVLLLVGQIRNIHPDFAQKHQRKLPWAFFAAAGLVCLGTIYSSYRQSQASSDLQASISGGDSYPIVIPQHLEWPQIPLVILNSSKYAIPSVGVDIEHITRFTDTTTHVDVGVLPAHVGEQTIAYVAPTINNLSDTDGHGEPYDEYSITMNTRNGVYWEIIHIKPGRCIRWVVEYGLTSYAYEGSRKPISLKPRWTKEPNCVR